MPRAFVAIDIGSDVRERLSSVQRRLAATGARLRLVDPPNIHVTMKFLGNVPEHRLEEIKDAVRKAASVAAPYDVEVYGLGAFPSTRYIRVIWAGVKKGREETLAIQQQLDRNLAELNFRPEKDFVPHLTIARVKSGAARDKLAALLAEMSNVDFGGSHVDAIELKQSRLTPKGPIYSTLERVELD
jgi:2'-5' RNA ligase